MVEFSHTYSLSREWQETLAKDLVKMGGEVINENVVKFPESIADGSFYCTEVMEGLSVVVVDVTGKVPVLVRRLRSDEDLYIIHYDFSDEMNLIHVEDVKHKIGYKANLGLAVFDNATDNNFQPAIGQRIYALRLLVSKELLKFSVAKEFARNSDKRRIKKSKNKLFFYDHIDSESKIIMRGAKDKNFLDPGFEMFIRGIALKLLGKFVDRYTNLIPLLHSISEKEAESLHKTKEYLLNNLLTGFPGVAFLADMAEMSMSKYMSLFKKMYTTTPNSFFWREKIILTNELLKSGRFDSISEVLEVLDNIKLGYLSEKYYRAYKKNPYEDFVKADY
ncbi:hypothetical protein [Flavobacterium sp. DG2-3]|uniref:hypothetical protein n=1 Tax=Flavobacterium sp. DG2-3 TaxID=3068317 RepID=UPI00273E436B|nr:hypothetical protein [Flavobacterium sp. DG2-3]MDP5199133.1 hypothetical protein [Flavobacterium sp. DG2-3]